MIKQCSVQHSKLVKEAAMGMLLIINKVQLSLCYRNLSSNGFLYVMYLLSFASDKFYNFVLPGLHNYCLVKLIYLFV